MDTIGYGMAEMTRNRHKDKEIEAAIAYPEAKGWRIEMRSGHAWARMYCPGNHARQIRRIVDNCSGNGELAGESDHES